MAHYNKIFNKVPIQVLNKSGFDMSHENFFTANCGTLVPCMVDELLPNDTISLGVASQINLPPMATDFYGRIYADYHAFFVPFRILYGGWQELITHPQDGDIYPEGTPSLQKSKYLPYLTVPAAMQSAGTLADYLGFKRYSAASTSAEIANPLPFLAYHKIYDDWYRDSRIQRPCFTKGNSPDAFNQLPTSTNYNNSPLAISFAGCTDGVSAFALRQRNWSKDYFTNATPKPQAGEASTLAFDVDTAEGTGAFTIASLRAANSLQQWMERNNLAGYRYGDQIKAQFGIYPSDAVTDRAIYLGSVSTNVYNKSVYTQSNPDSSTAPSTNNPFKTAGAKYASPVGVGNGSLVEKFTATEHGFIFVMFSLMPQAMYSTGTRRYLTRSSSADFAFPILSGVGDQEIYNSELVAGTEGTFGYTQRYSEYKFMDDQVHGKLRDGQDLSSFCLQRTFASSPALGSDFLKVPTDFLDQVTAVTADASKYGCWVDAYFKYKKSSTLPAYSIPTLGDLHNTHTEVIDNGGKRL